MSLEKSEQFMEGENKVMFVCFVRKMLQWRPEDRKMAKELLEDPWLTMG
jgi:serine/threonine-protein kinase SRPK3